MLQNLLASTYQKHFQTPLPIESSPIKKGASGRTIIRMKAADTPSVIGIHYTHEREDNALHKPISDLLEGNGVSVPKILFSDLESNILLIEDIGGTDLLSLRDEAWEVREPYYQTTFTELAKLSTIDVPSGYDIMPAFTEETYRWEQEYFAEHFIGTHLGLDPKSILSHPKLVSLAHELGSSQPNLVHRDFQSQNLMVRDDQTYIIDFQGARLGHTEYDLASFIYDPYMKHPLNERKKLRSLWEKINGEPLNPDLMRKCALQRLMQALGAYGNIVHNQKNDWYAQHIVPASEMLLSLAEGSEYEEVLGIIK